MNELGIIEQGKIEKIRHSKLLVYDIKVLPLVSNMVRSWVYKDKECMSIVVCNLISCIRKSNLLVYSRNTSGLVRTQNRRNISSSRVIRCVDFLDKAGLIENIVGSSSRLRDFRSASYMTPTQKFINMFISEDVQMRTESEYLKQTPVLELRDVNKNPMSFRYNEEIQRMDDVVRELNNLNETAVIRDKDGTLLTNIYCRIFNESFDKGGRWYRADVLGIKNKDDNARLDITINGESVVEIDYANLHFRIAAVLEDLDNMEIPVDVYSKVIDDDSNKVERNIVKLSVNIMFNSNSHISAQRAIQSEINRLSLLDKEQFTLGSAKVVMARIFKHYPSFEYLFCNGDDFGMTLQNFDSNIASMVIEFMLERDIPTLVVHDSFIVPYSHMETLIRAMGEAFRRVLGTDHIIPVGVKFKSVSELGTLLTKETVLA